MLLQAITIADQRYERARRSVDFIQRYIFPGSCIPSISVLCASIARASNLRVLDLDDIGLHYVRTLREWRRNMLANLPRIKELGYSEGGFAERVISDVHLLLVKPGNRWAPD